MKKRIIVVAPYTKIPKTNDIRLGFLAYPDWEVRLISPNERHYHQNAVLLIPDTHGLNTACDTFLRGENVLPAPCPAQDQAVEYFRLNTMQWYIDKNVPILGIGYSALLIFADICRGLLMWGPDGLCATGDLTVKSKVFWDGEFFVQKDPVLAGGLLQYSIEEVVVAAEKLLTMSGSAPVEVAAEIPPTPDGGLDVNVWK